MWQPRTKEAVLREVRIREWRARVGRAVKNALLAAGRQVVAGCSAAWRWLQAWSASTAQEVERNRLLSQRYDKLRQLGERAYALYRSGTLSWEALVPLCREIERLDAALDAARPQPLVVVADERPTAQSATGT